jgi:hypothetical protein
MKNDIGKLLAVSRIQIMSEEVAITQDDMDAAVAKAVSDATGGLNTKNSELLEELRTVKEGLSKFDGFDSEDVKKTMSLFNQSEEAQLLKDGKFDEVIDKRTEKLRGEYDGKISDMKRASDSAIENGKKFESLYKNKMVDDTIRKAALSSKVIPEALDDVLRRGRDVFSIGDDGVIEARGSDGELIKIDDHLMDPARFVDGLKKTAPYYWPSSSGTGATGSGGSSADMNSSLLNAASSGDSAAYRAMRRKQQDKT